MADWLGKAFRRQVGKIKKISSNSLIIKYSSILNLSRK